ncbi:MAG: hypothetical protein V1706_02705 [Pseudomonadota bacterium]
MKISETPQPFPAKTTLITQRGDTSKSQDTLPKFNQGDLIKAKVMGLTGDGKVVLDVNGKILTAQSLIELKVGSELWLEVGKGGGLPLLALAGKKGAVHDFLKIFLSGTFASAEEPVGKTPISLLAPLAQEMQGRTIPTGLISAVISGEPDSEVVKVLTTLLSGHPATKKEIFDLLAGFTRIKTVEEMGTHSSDRQTRLMAVHQDLNSQPPQGGNPNFYLFPCFFAGNTGGGEWLLALERNEDQKGRESFALSFFLDMSGIGPLAIHASVADKAISGEFCLQSEKARHHMSANVPELCRILEVRGYHPVAFSCRVETQNIVSQLKEKLEQKASINRFSLIDVNV